MLSSQSREFHKFFAQLIVAATILMVLTKYFIWQNFVKTIFAKFRIVFAFFAQLIFAQKFAKYERKFSHFFTKVFIRWKSFAGWVKLNKLTAITVN